MLEKFVNRLLQLDELKQITIAGREYTTKTLSPVFQPTPKVLKVHSLTGLRDYVLSEDPVKKPLLHIIDHATVGVIGALQTESFMERNSYATACHDLPVFHFGTFMDAESFNISLQSMFVQDDITAQVLKIVGNLKTEDSVITKDNGIAQEVTAKTGISMVEKVELPNPVTLRPYRTFREVEQPASKFVLRMKAGGYCALFEADGKQWQLEAIESIKTWLETALPDIVIIA
jgi:hypothetical protein